MCAKGGASASRSVYEQDGAHRTVSYAELAALSNRIAHVLTGDMKLVPGNRVLLRGPNNLMMAACWLAVVKAGLIAVPTMLLLRAKELKQVIDRAAVSAALCDRAPARRTRSQSGSRQRAPLPEPRRRCATSTAAAAGFGGSRHGRQARVVRRAIPLVDDISPDRNFTSFGDHRPSPGQRCISHAM
ncbi:AMP-binding protein [Cupriavidus basilensis]